MARVSHERAVFEYAATIEVIREKLRRLQTATDNFYNRNPERVNAASVDTIRHVESLIDEVLAFVEGGE